MSSNGDGKVLELCKCVSPVMERVDDKPTGLCRTCKLPIPLPKNIVTLVIVLNETTHELSMNGPINDKLKCYGMLELAKDAVRDWRPNPEMKPRPKGVLGAFGGRH